MSRLAAAGLRARRWDVLVLGGALPGLVAATRLAMAGHRILVVEEEAAVRTPPLLREPFGFPGPAADGVLDPCLRALGLAPIERRAFETVPVAWQWLEPRARVDVGGAVETAEEWVAWGLAKPEEARDLTRGLEAAARAECEAMLSAPLVRDARRSARARLRGARGGDSPADTALPVGPVAQRHPRGLPEAVLHAGPSLTRAFAAQVRVLSGLAAAQPSPEARARLLGASLAGGGTLHREDAPLRDLLRRRLESLHAEFRTVGRPFEIARVGEHPGIAGMNPGEAWLGRAVLINAPATRLAAALESWGHKPPRFLVGAASTHRRLAVHLRAVTEVVPEGLARRAIVLPHEGGEPVALSRHPSPRGSRFCELVARRVVPDEPDRLEEEAAAVERVVVSLMPFSEGRMARAPQPPLPLWDDEAALADPPNGEGWPCEVVIRETRAPVFLLHRAPVAGLGIEGDLLLGWRSGDAIAESL